MPASTASLEEERNSPSGGNGSGSGTEKEPLTPKQRHQMKHRELFLSRQVETLPATHIRGKCSVTLLNETESILSYLNKDVSSMTNIEFQWFSFTYLLTHSGGCKNRKIRRINDKIVMLFCRIHSSIVWSLIPHKKRC